MKEKLLKIINATPQSEPIYQLEFEYKKLVTNEQKDEFFSIIKYLAIKGTEKEKFASLTTIELLDKAKESEDVIKSSIVKIDFKKSEKLISPLLTLSAMLSTVWAIDFIKKVINYFEPKSNEYSYYFDIGIRSIVATTYWKEAIKEIKWVIKNYEDEYVIDFVAYFKWKRGESELAELYKFIDYKTFLINNLKSKIEARYVNSYGKINQND